MSDAISVFHRAYPEVEIKLDELSGVTLIPQLEDGLVDVGFVRLPLPAPASKLTIVGRTAEHMVVACPSNHPLAAYPEIAPADLRGETFLTVAAQAHAGLPALFWRVCADGGFIPHVALTLSHIAAVISLVKAGLGVSLVPETVQSMRLEGVAYRPLLGRKYVSEVAIVVRSHDRTPVVGNFMRVALQFQQKTTLK
jgi:DNA-binding transcriptional LysR family regulator